MRYKPCAAGDRCNARNFNPANSTHHCSICKEKVHFLSCSKRHVVNSDDANKVMIHLLQVTQLDVLEVCDKCYEEAREEVDRISPEVMLEESGGEDDHHYTDEQRAVMEVVNMLKALPVFEYAAEAARKKGWTETDMDMYFEAFEEYSSKRVRATDSNLPHDNSDEVNDKDDNVGYENNKKTVEKDAHRLLSAARDGHVFIHSWYKDDPEFVIVIRLPEFISYQVDRMRCEFLHEIIPHHYITFMHNSIAGYYQQASYGMKEKWCMGYNVGTAAFSAEFMGNSLYLHAKELFKIVYEGVDFDYYNPASRDVQEKLAQWNCGGDEPPNSELRRHEDYKKMLGWKETLPSIQEIKEKIGENRYEELVKYCNRNFIDCQKCEKYLMECEGLHALLPGLWLPWQALVANPHLFRVFDYRLQEWQQRDKSNTTEPVHDEEEGQDPMIGGEMDRMEMIEDANNKKKKKFKYVDTYANLRKSCDDDLASFVAKCQEYLEKDEGVMQMMKGELDGALKKWETRGNVYATLNLIRAIMFYLSKRDRFDQYGGDGFDVKVFTKEYMEKAGMEALTIPGCTYQVRMPLPAVFIQSICFGIGKGGSPITGMTAIVYIDGFRECPVEVHRLVLKEN